MRLEFNDGDETTRVIGAIVIRSDAAGTVRVDFGPADGAPLVSFTMDAPQARNLADSLKGVADGGDETVLIVDD